MGKLITELQVNTKGEIQNEVSDYKPTKSERNRIKDVMRDMQNMQRIMDEPYEEFGSSDDGAPMDLITRLNKNQKMFNLYRSPKDDDPDLQWHSNALRPIIRNKVISIVAHITSSILYPKITAQNEDAEEDQDIAVVMKDAVLWACEQSDYEDMFIDAVQDMCVNPAIVLYQDFAEVTRKIKEKNEDGKIEIKEIVDDIYSGFINSIIPCDELYIGNIYEPNIQKQPYLVRVKEIDYEAAKRKYGNHLNFKYVKPGIRMVFNSQDELYYEDYDENQEERLVQEVIYYNRNADLELVLVNGVLLTDPDRALRRKDKRYPFAKSFYESYNSRFFYGMSLVQKMESDEEIINTLYQMIIDGSYLQLMPPIAVYGATDLDTADFEPRGISRFDDPNVKVETLGMGGNLNAGFSALNKVEASLAESSNPDPRQGIASAGSQTATEIQMLERNAKIVLGRTGKMVGKLVRDFGELLVGSLIQHLAVAEIGEMVGDSAKLKFPVLFLQHQNIDGKEKSKKIEFTVDLPEAETEEELEKAKEKAEFKLLEEEEEKGMAIVKVNPDIFRRMKYLVKVIPSFIDNNTKFAKAMMLYDRGIQNDILNKEKLTRNTLLKQLAPGEEDEYILGTDDPVLREAQKIKPNNSNMAREAFTETMENNIQI